MSIEELLAVSHIYGVADNPCAAAQDFSYRSVQGREYSTTSRDTPCARVRIVFDEIPEIGTHVLKGMLQPMEGTCSLATLQKGS
jgi:hypothetical protein